MDQVKLGDVSVTRVEDFVWTVGHDFLFPQLTAKDFAPHGEWMQPRFLTAHLEMHLAMQTFVVRTPHHTILVDTCIGNGKERPIDAMHMLDTDFLEKLAAQGVRPEDVDYVFCTHFHSDHIGWNTRLSDGKWVPTFPKARYLFHRPEFEHYANLSDENQPGSFRDSVLPVVEAGQADLVDGDHAIGDHLLLEPTPGHTAGHCSVRLSGGDRTAFITGDMLHTPAQIPEPQWVTQVCFDKPQAIATRRAFNDRYAGSDTLILGTHFAAPTAFRIEGNASGFMPAFLGD